MRLGVYLSINGERTGFVHLVEPQRTLFKKGDEHDGGAEGAKNEEKNEAQREPETKAQSVQQSFHVNPVNSYWSCDYSFL
jgi:hypothetical protein